MRPRSCARAGLRHPPPTPEKNSAYASATRPRGQAQARAIGILPDRREQLADERGDALSVYGHGPSLRGRGSRLTGGTTLRGLLGRALLDLDGRGGPLGVHPAGHLDRRLVRDRPLVAREPLRARREALDVLEDLGELDVVSVSFSSSSRASRSSTSRLSLSTWYASLCACSISARTWLSMRSAIFSLNSRPWPMSRPRKRCSSPSA